MKKRFSIGAVAVATALAFTFTACSDESSPSAPKGDSEEIRDNQDNSSDAKEDAKSSAAIKSSSSKKGDAKSSAEAKSSADEKSSSSVKDDAKSSADAQSSAEAESPESSTETEEPESSAEAETPESSTEAEEPASSSDSTPTSSAEEGYTMDIPASDCGNLWCGPAQYPKVKTGFKGGGKWFYFDDVVDAGDAGKTIITFTEPLSSDGSFESHIEKVYGIEFNVQEGTGYYHPYAGVAFPIGQDETGNDISGWKGICITYKADKSFYIKLHPVNKYMNAEENNHKYLLPKSSLDSTSGVYNINTLNIPWAAFKQASYVEEKTDVESVLSQIDKISLWVSCSRMSKGYFKIISLGKYGSCANAKNVDP